MRFAADKPMGIVLWRGAFVYGVNHGHLQWAPDWVKRAIVRTWNPVACRLWGHYWIGLPDLDPERYDYDKCANCRARKTING